MSSEANRPGASSAPPAPAPTAATAPVVNRLLRPRPTPAPYDTSTVLSRYQLMSEGDVESMEPGCSALDCAHSLSGAVETCAGLECSSCCVSVVAQVGRAVRKAQEQG